jgi:hypothetical protein
VPKSSKKSSESIPPRTFVWHSRREQFDGRDSSYSRCQTRKVSQKWMDCGI